jgi:hypothetical protein
MVILSQALFLLNRTRKVQRLERKLVPYGYGLGEAPDTLSPRDGTGEEIVQAQKKFWERL